MDNLAISYAFNRMALEVFRFSVFAFTDQEQFSFWRFFTLLLLRTLLSRFSLITALFSFQEKLFKSGNCSVSSR